LGLDCGKQLAFGPVDTEVLRGFAGGLHDTDS
jgi:hypothetical protein